MRGPLVAWALRQTSQDVFLAKAVDKLKWRITLYFHKPSVILAMQG
jgi:uncharacterized Tic20 family protein